MPYLCPSLAINDLRYRYWLSRWITGIVVESFLQTILQTILFSLVPPTTTWAIVVLLISIIPSLSAICFLFLKLCYTAARRLLTDDSLDISRAATRDWARRYAAAFTKVVRAQFLEASFEYSLADDAQLLSGTKQPAGPSSTAPQFAPPGTQNLVWRHQSNTVGQPDSATAVEAPQQLSNVWMGRHGVGDQIGLPGSVHGVQYVSWEAGGSQPVDSAIQPASYTPIKPK